MNEETYKNAINKLAEILGGDNAFEADCVSLDKEATEREKILTKVVHDCYSVVHPLTSDCCNPLSKDK